MYLKKGRYVYVTYLGRGRLGRETVLAPGNALVSRVWAAYEALLRKAGDQATPMQPPDVERLKNRPFKKVVIPAAVDGAEASIVRNQIKSGISNPKKPSLTHGYAKRAWQLYVEACLNFCNSWIHLLFSKAKKGAAGRNIEFLVTFEEFIELLILSGGNCSVTGHPFAQVTGMECKLAPFNPSVDRINSAGPYSKANCRVVCVATNFALNEWGLGVFHRLATSYVAKSALDTAEALR